ncbi:hypothetical protein RA21_17870 [Leisingera sp. ANG-DT]|nr:hypothetical protein RA21_17870 [Leisingera sp. ANG-DT]
MHLAAEKEVLVFGEALFGEDMADGRAGTTSLFQRLLHNFRPKVVTRRKESPFMKHHTVKVRVKLFKPCFAEICWS